MKKETVQLDVFRNRVAEVTLSYRNHVNPQDRPKINDANSCYEILKPFFEDVVEYRERVVMVLLNRNHRVLGVLQVSDGGVTGTVLDPKIIFQGALKANATGLIIAHNHPSGNDSPSQQDIAVTKKLVQCGQLLEIQVLDHMIITARGYKSLANDGLM